MAFPTTDLEVRYEAKDESAYSDGQEATTVTDQSGNSRDAVGVGVTWQSGILNGHAVYRFDGTDDEADFLLQSPIATVNAWSMSLVVVSHVSSDGRLFPMQVGPDSGNFMSFTEGETDFEWGIFARTTAGDGKVFTSGADTEEWTHLLLVWDGTTVELYRDGSLVGDTGLGGDFEFEDIRLGEFLGAFFDGDIALAASWSAALDSTERTDLQDYVDSTYFPSGGVTIDTEAAEIDLRAGDTELDLTGLEIDTEAGEIDLRAGETTLDLTGLTIDSDAGRIDTQAGETSLDLGALTINTEAAVVELRAAITSVDSGGEVIDTQAARIDVRAGVTTLDLGEFTVSTEAARIELRAGVTTVDAGGITVDTQAARLDLEAGTTEIVLGSAEIDTLAGRIKLRAGITSVDGGDIETLGEVTCQVLMPTATRAVLSPTVTCEVI